MSQDPGTRIGPYEVVAQIGAGGMGEVYRARDTKLDRDVAIKVLPASLAADTERIARFEREAKTLASLNHPGIAAIYGFESSGSTRALVMELVAGPTLAERVAQGPIPVAEALPIARQIAEALEAAHEQGIVHRDLKPANVKVRPDGTVKVLDFGLAKAIEPASAQGASAGQAPSLSPTITTPAMTQAGVILGTAAYMSPEQARGQEADRRSDIWALGVVLFEMLTGQSPFAAPTVSDSLARVLERQPDLGLLPPRTPAQVRTLLRRCLQKDPRERLQHVGDVRLEIAEALAAPVQPVGEATGIPREASSTRAAVWAVIAALVAGLAVWVVSRPGPAYAPVTRVRVSLPDGQRLTGATSGPLMAVSPDGTRLVYTADRRLYLKAMDELDAIPIPGTELAEAPFFSSDGAWIAFTQGGELKRVAVAGGSPLPVTPAPETISTASWSEDGTILYARVGRGILGVPGSGGTPDVLVPVSPVGEGSGFVMSPQALPGGQALLFSRRPSNSDWSSGEVVVLDRATGEQRVVVERGKNARYVSTGHVVYMDGQTLYAVPFDVERLECTGGPVAVVTGIAGSLTLGVSQFDVSASGTLAYGTAAGTDERRRLVWVERDGTESPVAVEGRAFEYPRLSPDGRRVAVGVREAVIDLLVHDTDRGTTTPVTFDGGEDESPLWLDDRHLIWAGDRGDARQTLRRSADGSGDEEVVPMGALPHHHLGAWSPAASLLAYTTTDWDLWIADLGGGGDVQPTAFVQTETVEQAPTFSPDGRWMAYASMESGTSEIYVESVPRGGPRRLVSVGGGTEPLWSPDGRRIFYRGVDRMMVVSVETDAGFESSPPDALFVDRYARLPWRARNYDVTPDGRRFLMVTEAPAAESEGLVVVLNWFEELRRRVPVN